MRSPAFQPYGFDIQPSAADGYGAKTDPWLWGTQKMNEVPYTHEDEGIEFQSNPVLSC